MKKNKIIFAASAFMLMASAAPIYYWKLQDSSRTPSSVETFAHPEFAEEILIKSESLPLKIDEPKKDEIKVAEQVSCQKDDAKKLEHEIKKLIEDKEKLLSDIDSLKSKKNIKPTKKVEEMPLATQENMMSMMMQMTSLMLSQQQQQQMLNMQIIQLMSSLQNSDNIMNEYMSPYSFSYNQFAQHASPRFSGQDFSMQSQYVGLPMGGIQKSFSASPAYYPTMAYNPYQASYQSKDLGLGMGTGAILNPQGGIGIGMGSFENQGQVSMPIGQDGYNFEQNSQNSFGTTTPMDVSLTKVMF